MFSPPLPNRTKTVTILGCGVKGSADTPWLFLAFLALLFLGAVTLVCGLAIWGFSVVAASAFPIGALSFPQSFVIALGLMFVRAVFK